MPKRTRVPERRAWLRRAAALLAGLAAAAATTTIAAAGFDLAQLTAQLARVKSGEATFTEKRRVEMLDRTLESSGRLVFRAPDTFIRETLKPRREKLEVSGNVLTMSLGDRSRTLQLDSAPEAAVIVEAVRGTLTGNREALERLFECALSGSAERWSLDLVPRDLRLRGQVASVRVSGRGAVVREVQVLLADGDRSTMTIEPLPASAAP
ncbi:MAG: outer membrane lipoprotein carrier protein LolA [Burkholderiales bacterium]|nr:outer membrane lipoprotein carrier protein LolA [Burkholderiales bacterium]